VLPDDFPSLDFPVPLFYSRSTRSPLVPHWPDFLASLKLLVFCCCVDFTVDVCRILPQSLLPAPRVLACSQVSSLRFLLPRFFLLGDFISRWFGQVLHALVNQSRSGRFSRSRAELSRSVLQLRFSSHPPSVVYFCRSRFPAARSS
jgi:hypothetical protein